MRREALPRRLPCGQNVPCKHAPEDQLHDSACGRGLNGVRLGGEVVVGAEPAPARLVDRLERRQVQPDEVVVPDGVGGVRREEVGAWEGEPGDPVVTEFLGDGEVGGEGLKVRGAGHGEVSVGWKRRGYRWEVSLNGSW